MELVLKRLILVLAILACTNAYATQGGESNNTGCNGVGNANSPCDPGTTTSGGSSTVTNTVSPTITVSGSTSSTGAITNTVGGSSASTGAISNTNTANGGAATSNSTGGTATATGGNGGMGGMGQGFGGSSYASGGTSISSPVTSQSQTSDRHDTTNNTNRNTLTNDNSGNNTGTSASTSSNTTIVQGDQAQARNPVATAIGPTIVTGSDQCLVAVSVGFQAIGFGFAAGSAVEDQNCQALKLARQLDLMGYKAQALKLLMQDPRVKAAFE